MAKPGPSPEVTPEDVLEAIRSREDPHEPVTAPEIGDMLACSRRTALNKLEELAERGLIESKKVGGRSRVWWVTAPRTDSNGTAVDPEEDPVLAAPTFASGEDGVSAHVDEHLSSSPHE